MNKKFAKPIPGMSLTQTPKNAPWERAPQITDPDKAIQFHLGHLSDPDKMEKALYLLESDTVTLNKLVEGLMRKATYDGIHSIDVGLVAAPVVHEFIKQTAEVVGIDYDEGFEDMEQGKRENYTRVMSRARKMLKEADFDIPEVSKEDVMDAGNQQGAPVQDDMEAAPVEVTMEEPRKGLMSRGEM